MTKKHCCKTMMAQVNIVCEQHEDPFDCPDQLIDYNAKFDEYGLIIHDGGSSSMLISFCPWCGERLPLSKRDLWFDKLEKLGFDNPYDDNIPEEFQSEKWYNHSAKEGFK
jgi:hypothetical protein